MQYTAGYFRTPLPLIRFHMSTRFSHVHAVSMPRIGIAETVAQAIHCMISSLIQSYSHTA